VQDDNERFRTLADGRKVSEVRGSNPYFGRAQLRGAFRDGQRAPLQPASGWLNRPVNRSGSAAVRHRRRARPVADRAGALTAINRAHTHFREWSSVPVSALALVPISGNPPTMSICHNSIGARLATRRRSLRLPKPAGQKGQSRGYRHGFAALDCADSCFTTRAEAIRSHRPQVIRRGS
jgi:hypothetical protein